MSTARAGLLLRFGSLFSGVGGFDLGLEAAGMRAAWQVEIDPQARAVLRRHWPDMDLHEDVRNVGGTNLAPVDLICAGVPCQDVSVAGRRAGLAGERTGLFFDFIRIADEVAPRWLLFENVPGLLSSQRGEDFAVCLEGFTGFRPAVPEGGWRNSGLCVGPLRWAAWCVLDSQFFGVPQRRRRVFIVGHLGAPCPPEILLEPESLPGDTPARGEAGEGVAGTVAGGARSKGGFSYDDVPMTANNLPTKHRGDPHEGTDTLIAHTLRAEGFDASEDGTGRGTPLVVGKPQDVFCDLDGHAPTLAHSSNTHGGHHQPKVLTYQASDYAEGTFEESDLSRPLTTSADRTRAAPIIAFDSKQSAADAAQDVITHAIPRRLTPTETERLMGWPDGWTAEGVNDTGERVRMADGPRYRMCGNGVVASVAAWVGRRIVQASMIVLTLLACAPADRELRLENRSLRAALAESMEREERLLWETIRQDAALMRCAAQRTERLAEDVRRVWGDDDG